MSETCGEGGDDANGGFKLMDPGCGWITNEGISFIWFLFEISWVYILWRDLASMMISLQVSWLELLDVIGLERITVAFEIFEV